MKLDPIYEGSCPACGFNELRQKFADKPNPIVWCPSCMAGMGLPNGPVVDMHLFSSAIVESAEIMRLRRESVQKPKPTYEELEAEVKRYKETVDHVHLMCRNSISCQESTDTIDDIFDSTCDALGLDYSIEWDRAFNNEGFEDD